MRKQDITTIIDLVLSADTDDFCCLVNLCNLDKSKDFRYANLSDVNFGTINLSGFDFTGADLRNSDLRWATNIEKAIFRETKTEGVRWPVVSQPPRVFISYSHDGEAHEMRVLDLANRLREGGIDAELDQFETSPAEGWPAWCERRIEEADFVLLVCTETYRRRFDDEDPGKGLGVLYEARMLRQLIYDSGGTGKYIPVLLSGGSPDYVPTIVKGATRWEADTEDGYDGLYRQLTGQPKAIKPVLGAITPKPPRESRSGPAAAAVEAAAARPAGGSAPHARVADVFVGRTAQLGMLAACLLPADPAKRRPVAVMGMAGVGKSYLVDRFFINHRAAFPGGYHRLAVDADRPGSAEDLLALLADRLKLPAADDAALAAALTVPPALVHVESIDTPEAAEVAGRLAGRLPGCALVFSARMGTLAVGTGWGKAVLATFAEDDALAQLRAELGPALPSDDALRPVIAALGGLPLALHLAAGHLEGGETPASFLKLLRQKGLSLAPLNPADPSFLERSHTRLEAVFTLSLAALGRAAEAVGRPAAAWTAALHALGYGPAAGFGESLGAALAGLPEDAFGDLARAACALSLLDRVPRGGGTALRLHPLLAELGRREVTQEEAVARLTGWFCDRLPEPEDQEQSRWNEVHAETEALVEWLLAVPKARWLDVSYNALSYAVRNGPLREWMHFYEKVLASDFADNAQSRELAALSTLALHAGFLDYSFELAEKKLALDRKLVNHNGIAGAADIIAQIYRYRGDFDAALNIRLNEQIPAYENQGDERGISVTYRSIADIYIERSGTSNEDDLAEAFRLLNEESIPRAQRLGRTRDLVVFKSRVGVILYRQRKFREAINTYCQDVLPFHEQLGEKRSIAVTKGLVADVLSASGELGEAIRMRHEEVIPLLESIEEPRELTLARMWQAKDLLKRAETGDRGMAQQLLCLALTDAQLLRIPQAGQIEAFLQQQGLRCP